MSKHTPGPWKLLKNEDSEEYTVTTKDGEPNYHRGLASVSFGFSEPVETEQHANAKLIAAAPEMFAILDELEDSFGKEIYPEQKKEDFDAPDDREYTVTITAKQWRALGHALGKAHGAT